MVSCLILGALAGAALGLTGAGGGIIAIPLLTFGADLTHAQAAPIALLAIAMAAGVGAILGFWQGLVRYRAAAFIGCIGMLAAPAGVWLAARTPENVLTLGLALVMALSATTMFRRSLSSANTVRDADKSVPCHWSAVTGRFVWTRLCATVMAGIGLSIGFLSGLLGVGGGFLVVPALTRLSNLQVGAIVRTSQAVIALVSAASAATTASQRELQWSVALPFMAAAVVSLVATGTLSRHLPPRFIQRTFAGLSGGIALALFFNVLKSAGV